MAPSLPRIIGVMPFSRPMTNASRKLLKIQPGTGQTELVGTVAHQHIEPDLGDTELVIDVDVQVVRTVAAQAGEIPGILRILGIQHIARQIAERLLVVIEVVAATALGDHEPGVVSKVAAKALGLGEELLAALRIVFAAQPLAGQLGVSQALRQCQLAPPARRCARGAAR